MHETFTFKSKGSDALVSVPRRFVDIALFAINQLVELKEGRHVYVYMSCLFFYTYFRVEGVSEKAIDDKLSCYYDYYGEAESWIKVLFVSFNEC